MTCPLHPDYSHYLLAGGKLPEGRFAAALPGACAAVDEAIWPNVVTDATQYAYRNTVCAVVDLIDSAPVASERIGSVAVTYLDVPTIAVAIRRGLVGTGLLYRGL